MEESPKPITHAYLRTLLSSLIIGLAYGLITRFNPFISVNIFLLAIMIALLLFLAGYMIKNRPNKSAGLNFVLLLSACFLAWLTSWVIYYAAYSNGGIGKIFTNPSKFIQYIINYADRNNVYVHKGTFGIKMNETVMAVLYVIELLVFMLPSVTAFRKSKE
jgi:hypothetical protein